MADSLLPVEPPRAGPVLAVRQADNDLQLIELWLHGRSLHTHRAYKGDTRRFLAFTDKALPTVTLGDLQAFQGQLEALSTASQVRTLAAVKSLLSFGHRIGYLPVDVGAALKLPSLKETLSERILPERMVHALITLEPDPRNKLLLRLLYLAGLRVSEICALQGKDLAEREKGAGQITVFGKGSKTRYVLLPAFLWQELSAFKAGAVTPVFRSRKGRKPLTARQVHRIVQAAAHRAGIEGPVSPHWLRHAHASHALDRGCPIHLVQSTLGHSSVATTGRYLHARPEDSSAWYLSE